MKTTALSSRSCPSLVLCELADPALPGLESMSTHSLKVHRALRLARLPYETRRARAPSDLRFLDPRGRVPVLLADDAVIVDSTRILRAVEDWAPGALVAGDARARSESWLWEDWADRALAPLVTYARWLDPRNWPRFRDFVVRDAPALVQPLLEALVAPRLRQRVRERLRARDVGRGGQRDYETEFRRVLDLLEARAPLEGFWIDARATVADLAIFAPLHGLRTPITPWQARELSLRPALTDWLDRVDEATRPADGDRVAMPRLPEATMEAPLRAPATVAARVPLRAAAFCG